MPTDDSKDVSRIDDPDYVTLRTEGRNDAQPDVRTFEGVPGRAVYDDVHELPYAPPFELWKTSGARRWMVAKFTTRERVIAYLTRRGFIWRFGSHTFKRFREDTLNDPNRPTYELLERHVDVPVDPE